jgi:hypothetical protein
MKRTRLFPAATLAALAVLACGSEKTTEPTDEEPAQYISVRRAWQPGERDSTAAYVLRARAWDEYSDLAPQAFAVWDSTTDIVLNPAWSPAASALPGTPAPPALAPAAPQFEAGWGSMGMDILIVFDSVPGGTVQRDSLYWIATRWWNPADSTWKGWIVRATTAPTFGWVFVSTTGFDGSGGHTGAGGGEARLASGTYWEANFGLYRITQNDSYGARQRIPAGPFLGGNVEFGLIGGQLWFVSMPRITGADTPATESVNWDFRAAPINAQRIRCYFPPITPPAGYDACTGQAFARIVAAAQAGRMTAPIAAGFAEDVWATLVPAAAARRGKRCRSPARGRRRATRPRRPGGERSGPLVVRIPERPSSRRTA